MAELWGSIAVDDHVGPRALVAAVLLFDRIVFPVPPDDDDEEFRRWERNKWDPRRQREFLDILGVGRRPDDLAVVAPWTPAKRANFRLLSEGVRAAPGERARLLAGLEYDSRTLAGADARHLTRQILTREYDAGEHTYVDRLPPVDVEAVVPAYQAADRAVAEFGLRTQGYGEQPGPSASLVG